MADHDRPAEEGRSPKDVESKDVEGGEGAPAAPVLAAPQEEALVNGEEVTLRWEPVESADAYLVEVAEDAAFQEVIVQEEVQDTTLALEALPTDGDLYYWRVLAHRAGQWSHGDRIESFVSVTAEQARTAAEGEGEAPNKSEDYGPAPALFSAAGTEAASEATRGEAMLEREREIGVAQEGVEAGQIIGLAGAVIVALVIIVCVLFFWVTSVAQTTRDTLTETSVYPELRENQTQAVQQLRQYELISERDSAYRIPIEEAMRIVANEAYEQDQDRRYSGELQLRPPAVPAGSLDADAFVPQPSVPEGPAGEDAPAQTQ